MRLSTQTGLPAPALQYEVADCKALFRVLDSFGAVDISGTCYVQSLGSVGMHCSSSLRIKENSHNRTGALKTHNFIHLEPAAKCMSPALGGIKIVLK